MEITEKKLEKILTGQREEYQRYIGVLAEDFGSKVQAIGEQHGSIIKKIDNLDKRVGRIEEDIAIIKLDIEFIKNDLKKKVDHDEFAALERRVALLEARS